jgi:hypothetical protein
MDYFGLSGDADDSRQWPQAAYRNGCPQSSQFGRFSPVSSAQNGQTVKIVAGRTPNTFLTIQAIGWKNQMTRIANTAIAAKTSRPVTSKCAIENTPRMHGQPTARVLRSRGFWAINFRYGIG